MTVYACVSENFHPYECDGPGKCVHCDRRVIQDDHDPETCELCFSPETPCGICGSYGHFTHNHHSEEFVSVLEDWEMSR